MDVNKLLHLHLLKGYIRAYIIFSSIFNTILIYICIIKIMQLYIKIMQ